MANQFIKMYDSKINKYINDVQTRVGRRGAGITSYRRHQASRIDSILLCSCARKPRFQGLQTMVGQNCSYTQ